MPGGTQVGAPDPMFPSWLAHACFLKHGPGKTLVFALIKGDLSLGMKIFLSPIKYTI